MSPTWWLETQTHCRCFSEESDLPFLVLRDSDYSSGKEMLQFCPLQEAMERRNQSLTFRALSLFKAFLFLILISLFSVFFLLNLAFVGSI